MSAQSSPTVKRRRLAAELRAHRERTGMTIEEVADHLEWSGAKISRIENARVSVLPRDVKYLLTTYGVPEDSEEWETLLALARESRQKGWWHTYGDAVSEGFKTYLGLEAEAAILRTYEAEYVPGLLQTEDYARTVLRTVSTPSVDEGTEQQLAVRMARQERLSGPGAPEFSAVLNEAVIRRPTGGSAVMREQLARLVDAAGQPNITLQILPFSAGAHPAMDGAFMLMSFPEPADPDVTYIHYPTGNIYLEKPGDITAYTLMFDRLCEVALDPGESRELIARARDDLP